MGMFMSALMLLTAAWHAQIPGVAAAAVGGPSACQTGRAGQRSVELGEAC